MIYFYLFGYYDTICFFLPLFVMLLFSVLIRSTFLKSFLNIVSITTLFMLILVWTSIFLKGFSVNDNISVIESGFESTPNASMKKSDNQDIQSYERFDNQGVMHNIRFWDSYKTITFSMAYDVFDRQADSSFLMRNRLSKSVTSIENMNIAYAQITKKEAKSLQFIYQKFDKIRADNDLDDLEFAKALVSFVQDVPYLVLSPGICESSNCQANVALGMEAPVEFLYNLKGDCDTRVLFLVIALRHYGIDAALLASYQYQHVMLGVSLPISGRFIENSGTKYYFWETTGMNWPAGVLPPSMQDDRYWQVLFGSELPFYQ
jgi:hypothetical protein